MKRRYIEIVNTGKIERFINTDIRIIGVLISLLISCFTILNPGLPNDDAYSYIRIAEIALNEGFNAGNVFMGELLLTYCVRR